MKTTYKTVGNLIANCKNFTNHQGNFRGKWDGNTYEIWSYKVVITQWSQSAGWHITNNKYSRTTSRQVKTIRQALKDNQVMEMIENLK